METTMKVEVPLQRLQDVWVNFLDSGAGNYWVASASVERHGIDSVQSLALEEQAELQERYIAPFRQSGAVKVVLDEPDDVPGHHLFDLHTIARGVEVLASKYPKALGDILSGNDDANTADIFVQACLFGELVYG